MKYKALDAMVLSSKVYYNKNEIIIVQTFDDKTSMTSKADKFISSGVPLEINFKDRPYSSYVESHLWLNFEALISFSTPLRRPQSSTQVTFYSKIFFSIRLKNIFGASTLLMSCMESNSIQDINKRGGTNFQHQRC